MSDVLVVEEISLTSEERAEVKLLDAKSLQHFNQNEPTKAAQAVLRVQR